MLLSYTTSPRDILPSYTANPRRFTFLARTSHWRQNHSEMSVGYKIAVRSAWYNKQLLHTYGVTGRLFRNIAICRKKRRQSGEIGNVVSPVVCVYSRPRTRRGTKLSVVYYHIVARPDRKLFLPLIYSADCESVAAYFFFGTAVRLAVRATPYVKSPTPAKGAVRRVFRNFASYRASDTDRDQFTDKFTLILREDFFFERTTTASRVI